MRNEVAGGGIDCMLSSMTACGDMSRQSERKALIHVELSLKYIEHSGKNGGNAADDWQ